MTFIFVDLSLAFFRAQTFANTATIFKNMFRVRNFWILFDGSLYNCGLDMKNLHFAFLCILILIFADICKKRKISLSDVLLKQDRILRCLIFAGAVIFILVFGKYGPAFDTNNFIYFQF